MKLRSSVLNEHLELHAKQQGITADELAEKVLIRCMELKLIETAATTAHSEEWANGPI